MATQILGKVGVVPKGEYNNSIEYERLDVVTYNGQSYMAKTTTQGNLPTNATYWQLLAEKGYTPVKGTDYWTASEQSEIINTTATGVETAIAPTLASIESTANVADTNASTAVSTANTAKRIAEGANQALSYNNYSSMIAIFNALESDVYKLGQNVMIVTLNVPDLWISSVESSSSTYTYTTDDAFTNALITNGYVQVGYYRLSALETQKVDLTNYYTKSETDTAVNSKYTKPLNGIPSTDMTSGVQTSLGKADTAVQHADYASQNVSGVVKVWTSYNEDDELGLNISTQ